MIGLGISFMVIVAFPVYILSHKASVYVCHGQVRSKCCLSWIEPKKFVIIAFVFLAESCLELGFWCSICIKLMEKERWSSAAEVFSSCLVFFFGISLIFVPIYQFVVGILYYKALKKNNEARIQKYEELFEGKRTSSIFALQYNVIFLMRRYSLIFMLILYPNNALTQIFGTMYLSVITIGYLAHARPFVEPKMNN